MGQPAPHAPAQAGMQRLKHSAQEAHPTHQRADATLDSMEWDRTLSALLAPVVPMQLKLEWTVLLGA